MLNPLSNHEKGDETLRFSFRDFKSLKELFRDIYYRNLSIEKAEKKYAGLTLCCA